MRVLNCWMRRFAVLLTPLVLAAAASQDATPVPERPTIRGVVQEVGTAHAVSEAEVELTTASTVSGSTVTDSRGAFEFHPDDFGTYRVQVKKDGWGAAGAVAKGFVTSQQTVLTKDRPTRELRFLMARPGRLSGVLQDAETGEPAVGVTLFAWSCLYHQGRRSEGTPNLAVSTAEGQFVFPALSPGDYLVQIVPKVRGDKRILSAFSDEDAKHVDNDYESTFWPGGVDLASAVPVAVRSGDSIYIGAVRARRVPLYRIRGSLAASDCGSADQAEIGRRRGGDPREEILGRVPCGRPFLLTGFEPGSYWLSALVANSSTVLAGQAPVLIKDETAKVSIPLGPGIDLDVRAVAQEGTQQPRLDRVRVELRPIGVGRAPAVSGQCDRQGRLRLRGVLPTEHTIAVFGPGDGYYVQEIRYNKDPVVDRVLRPNGGAMAQFLEIVVDDKPAALMGTVRQGD